MPVIQDIPHATSYVGSYSDEDEAPPDRVTSPSSVDVDEGGGGGVEDTLDSAVNSFWPCKSDFLLMNATWIAINVALAAAIITTAVAITVARCRQVNVDLLTTTQQAGSFVGEACTASSDCIINAQCYSNVCRCSPDFYLVILIFL